MWKALGACYAILQEDQDAAGCYTRAAECDNEGKHGVLIQLARVFDKMGKKAMASQYFKRAFEKYQEVGASTFWKSRCHMFDCAHLILMLSITKKKLQKRRFS